MYYFITASKDASIYLQQPTQNTGLDEVLEVSKTYYGNLKDISRSLIRFETSHFSSSIADGQIPLSNLLVTSQSTQTSLSQSWDTNESSSLHFSSSYSTYSASLAVSSSNKTNDSASLATFVSESNTDTVNGFVEASGSVRDLATTSTETSESWASQSLFESNLSSSYSLISASYNTIISSSFTSSLSDTSITTRFNSVSQSYVSAISQSGYFSSSYNTQSSSVYIQESDLTILENHIISSSESSSLASHKLISSASAAFTSSNNAFLTASSETTAVSQSWASFTSSSNYFSSSYNSFSTSLAERVSNDEFVFDFDSNLILRECESSEIPIDYTLYAYIVSQSWDMGIGTRFDEITTDGCSWNKRTTQNWLGNNFATGTTGSFNGKGGTWYTGSASSQSFSYESSDIEMDVKSAINSWVSSSFPNEGFIIKHDSSLENNTTDYGQIKFFSKETNTIYQPKLRMGWDDSTFNTGDLEELTVSPINVTFKRLKARYKEGSIPTIRVFGREKYPLKTYTNKYAYNDLKYLPSTTYYQIRDVVTDEIIIPFHDEYTKVSCDENGNFFKLNLKNYEINREYYIEIKTIRNGVTEYFTDKDLTFKVEL